MKLTYFNICGKAEPARLVLAAGNVPYKYVGINFHDWGKIKPSTPLGQLPILEFTLNGKPMVMPQSVAITKYLAKEHNLDGKNNLESALIDVVVQTVLEIFDFYYDVLYHLSEEDKIKQMPILKDERIPQTISKLKQLMDMYNPSGKTPYFVGDQLTLADLFVFYALDQFSKINPNIAEECDEVIKKNWDAVANTPSIAEYMKTRGY
ncbi:hypothetical protein GJ496_009878 [Pomphorhynchus laevis]|nr:hypothetical protein GJ496_009878 [Pomphorhynchus laevis]